MFQIQEIVEVSNQRTLHTTATPLTSPFCKIIQQKGRSNELDQDSVKLTQGIIGTTGHINPEMPHECESWTWTADMDESNLLKTNATGGCLAHHTEIIQGYHHNGDRDARHPSTSHIVPNLLSLIWDFGERCTIVHCSLHHLTDKIQSGS